MGSKPLSEQLEYFRIERPSEWLMGDFIKDAKELETQINDLRGIELRLITLKQRFEKDESAFDEGAIFGLEKAISFINEALEPK